MEVHRAKLKAELPARGGQNSNGGPQSADEVYARASAWRSRRAADNASRRRAVQLDHVFADLDSSVGVTPSKIKRFATHCSRCSDGCYVAFAGDTYCESRNETMDDCWRVMHALPGDGQNRPSVAIRSCRSRTLQHAVEIFKPRRTSTASRQFMRNPQVLDFDAALESDGQARRATILRARGPDSACAGFFNPPRRKFLRTWCGINRN